MKDLFAWVGIIVAATVLETLVYNLVRHWFGDMWVTALYRTLLTIGIGIVLALLATGRVQAQMREEE